MNPPPNLPTFYEFDQFLGVFSLPVRLQIQPWSTAWRIIPVSKWLVTLIYKPWSSPIWKGSHTPILRGPTITMVINHLQVMGWSSNWDPWGRFLPPGVGTQRLPPRQSCRRPGRGDGEAAPWTLKLQADAFATVYWYFLCILCILPFCT